MTDDIVARLRCYADINDAVFHPWVYAEAADEIERLRERMDDWRAAMTENHDLWRENERLRAVLDQLLDYMGEDGLCVCQQAKDEARAVLGEKAND